MIHVCTYSLTLYGQTNLIQAVHDSQLLVPKGHNCVQYALNTFLHAMLYAKKKMKTCPNTVLQVL